MRFSFADVFCVNHIVSIYKLQNCVLCVYKVVAQTYSHLCAERLKAHSLHPFCTSESFNIATYYISLIFLLETVTGKKYKAFFSASFECTCFFVQQMNNIIMVNQGIMESKVE